VTAAIAEFAEKNQDKKAAVLPVYDTLLGVVSWGFSRTIDIAYPAFVYSQTSC